MNLWKLFLILFLLAYFFTGGEAQVMYNKLMDEVMAAVRENIKNSKQDMIDTPELYSTWKYQWTFFDITGYCSCRMGTVRSMASIARTGQTTESKSGDKSTIKTKLSLKHLVFKFKNCHFQAQQWFSLTRTISGKVGKNSIDVVISMTTRQGKCDANVERVVLDNYGDLQVETGGGPLVEIENKIFEWFSGYFRNKIINIINRALGDSIRQALLKVDLCAKIPH
uniref:Secreted protein n=1 Tax=Panstrongylus lignarius TaxID=156445 RepID=A0A224XVY3_9HEMI